MADLKSMKGISAADKKLLEEAEEWLGAEPAKMGPVKNLFWGNIKTDYYFPYPQSDAREQAECDQHQEIDTGVFEEIDGIREQ